MRKRALIILVLGVIFVICPILFVFIQARSDNQIIIIGDATGLPDIESEKKANFNLILTNQNIYHTKVELTVYLDGNKLVNQLCEIEEWHTGYYYYYYLTGTHTLRVESDDGFVTEKDITFKKNKPCWVLTSYWAQDNDGIISIIIDILDRRFLWA